MIQLRPISSEDYELLFNLRNDPTTLANLHTATMHSKDQTVEFIRTLPKDKSRLVVHLKVNEKWHKVGIVRLDNIDYINCNLYIGLDIVPQFRKKGLARPIYNIALDYLFNMLNMEYIYLEYISPNSLLEHLYTKLGFKKCGVFPKKIKRHGQSRDSILMYMNKRMWIKANKREDVQAQNKEGVANNEPAILPIYG